jgi:predicted lipoprotein
MNDSRWKFWLPRAGCLLGLIVVFWWAPPFHIVELNAAQQAQPAFDAVAFVDKFWFGRLAQSLDRATDAVVLKEAIYTDSKAAREKYGRIAGLGGDYYFFVAGEGRVVSVGQHEVSLSLDANGSRADVVLETGNIFGNAVRDGTGLLNVSDFADSQDFNAISAEINRHIEEQVLPNLRTKAVVGAIVHFAGCAEIADEGTDLHTLLVVPVSAVVR